MLDPQLIRTHPDLVRDGIRKKGKDPKRVDDFLALDESWRAKVQAIDSLKQDQNRLSKELAGGRTDELLEKAGVLKGQIQALETEERELSEKREKLLLSFPNIPFEDVTVGRDESENVVAREVGKKRVFDFEPQDYLTLGESLGIINVKKASEISGSRFGYLLGGAALLEFALVSYTFQTLTDQKAMKKIADSVKKGYSPKPFVPVVPPQMIKPEVFERMARIEPRDERYYLQSDDLYLIGSAEHTLGPLHMDETLPESALPARYVGFSTSFRREAGSYGKDTKGILRVHQFDKLEMESFTRPEDSRTEQDFIVAVQEHLVRSLEIPYRVMDICTGDMGGPDARQIDIEMWMPGSPDAHGKGKGVYRETHTSDLMTDYQARRLRTKVKKADGTAEYAHMNDATAFAIGRTLIAIIENYQTKKGTVLVPKVLQPYMGLREILPMK